jgi:hypothetical protein
MSWSINASGSKVEALASVRTQAAAITHKPGTGGAVSL